MLNNDNCPHFVIWGLKDDDSWRSGSNPLLYTSSLSKKPAFYAVRSALRHRAILKEKEDISQPEIAVPTSDETFYDLCGRRVKGKPTTPGIYIQRGRKVVCN